MGTLSAWYRFPAIPTKVELQVSVAQAAMRSEKSRDRLSAPKSQTGYLYRRITVMMAMAVSSIITGTDILEYALFDI